MKININEMEKLNLDGQQDTKPASQYLNHLKVRKQSLTYRGAMLSIPKYRLRASSCPDIYWNSMVTIDVEVNKIYKFKIFAIFCTHILYT